MAETTTERVVYAGVGMPEHGSAHASVNEVHCHKRAAEHVEMQYGQCMMENRIICVATYATMDPAPIECQLEEVMPTACCLEQQHIATGGRSGDDYHIVLYDRQGRTG